VRAARAHTQPAIAMDHDAGARHRDMLQLSVNDPAGLERRKRWVSLTIASFIALGVRAAVAQAGPPDGAAVFSARCAKCHGASGKGDTPQARALKVRPLVNDAELARMTPPEIARAIKSDAKHQGMGSVVDLGDAELEAVAVFVKELATKR
jgi:mono/diheme cytochrome c family protein